MVGCDTRSQGRYRSRLKLVYHVILDRRHDFYSKRRHSQGTFYPSCSHRCHHDSCDSRVRFDRNSPLVRNHYLGPTGGCGSFMGLALCRRRTLCGRLCHQSQSSTRSCNVLSSRTNLLGKDGRFHHQQVQGQCVWDRQRLYPRNPVLLVYHKGTPIHDEI